MRLRPTYTLAFIVVLTLLAGWLCLPKDWLNPFGVKDNVYVHEGLDLQGGLQVLLEADPPEGQSISKDTMAGTRDNIERRVNELGVSEPLIQTRGSNQIIVELPGVSDPEQAVNTIKETALLEFIDPQGTYLSVGQQVNTTLGDINSVNASGTPEATPIGGTPGAEGTPGATPDTGAEATPSATAAAGTDSSSTGPVYTTIASGADIKDAYITKNQTGAYVVGFELKGDGSDAVCDFTTNNIGRPMTILVDKTVISSPTVNGAICGQGIIEGPPLDEVQKLVVQLKAGALNVPLTVKSSRTVGPTLGQESIDRSIVAGIVGLAAVALFMIFYYRLPGILSVLALVLYTLFVFALYKTIPVTLTLAGIAGFILSIGMAVDANVLIFARLKEELRLGRTLQPAIEAGFNHAWPSIRDSNISSMITAAILYWFGNFTGASIITGFALTLFIGVAVSMFTAITVTRTFLRLIVGHNVATHPWWFSVNAPGQGPGSTSTQTATTGD